MADGDSENELLAQELENVGGRVLALEARVMEVEAVIKGLEEAALTTARALEEVSAHWDAVYRAMPSSSGGERYGSCSCERLTEPGEHRQVGAERDSREPAGAERRQAVLVPSELPFHCGASVKEITEAPGAARD